MKKVTSVLATSLLIVSMATSAYAAVESNPFSSNDDFGDAAVFQGEETPAPSETKQVSVKTTFTTDEGKVKYTVSLNQPDVKIRTAKVIVNFPDSVSTTKEQITKGPLLEAMDDNMTTVDLENHTVTYSGNALTAVPADGELFTVEFDSNPGTVSQEYPFSVDVNLSEVNDELNNKVELTNVGIDMIKVGSAVQEKEEVKKETGFAENIAFLLIPLIASIAYVSRRKSV